MENGLIKKNIQKARRASGFTQESISAALGISTNSYCQIEIGKTKLISERLFDIAMILNTTPEELLLGYTPTTNESSAKYEDMERMYKEKIARIEAENKIFKVESEAEIQRLKAAVESKDKIIGVLKESLVLYSK
jgi:transcriptional regulator with XRE-family HTH domain